MWAGRKAGVAGGVVAVFALVIVALMSRPSVPPERGGDAPSASGSVDPARYPLLLHMAEEEGVRIGSDLVVRSAGEGRVGVTISDAFLARLPKDALARLGLASADTVLSVSGYERFLDDLHVLVAGPGHDHDHGHEHGGHEHEATTR